jgi:hypothetical protein
MNGKYIRIWKEVVVTYVKTLSHYLPPVTGEKKPVRITNNLG